MYRIVRNPYNAPHAGPSKGCTFLFWGSLLIVIVVVGVLSISPKNEMRLKKAKLVTDAEVSSAFSEFISAYGRAYSSSEEFEHRYKIFESNYKQIMEHNSNPAKTCTLGVNRFADLTQSEYEFLYLSKPMPQGKPTTKTMPPPDPNLNINWVELGKVSKVKDQGNCGSCWTFSTVSVVESIIAIKEERSPERYSEQQLVDCCRTDMSKGCHGGEEDEAFEYMIKKGIALESLYPYKAVDDVCKHDIIPPKVKISGYTNITDGDNEEMEKIIKQQTMAVGLAASHFVFRFYKSGVVKEGCPGEGINHAVTVVGAGTENNIPYWLVRNSWGPNWGEKGHIKIARVADGSNGICGISCCTKYVHYTK